MDLPAEITWNEAVKKRINDAVAEEVGGIRICQKVFPTRHLTSSPLDVLVDALDLPKKQYARGLQDGLWSWTSSLQLLAHRRETSRRA
jgi:hypothetical protein